MKVRDIMTTDVIFGVVPSTRKDVLSILLKHKVTGIPIVRKNTKKVVGIVTRTDLIEKASEEQTALLMNRDPITITPDANVHDAVKLFVDNNIRRLPVVSNNELVGIITVADVIHKMISNLKISKPIKEYVIRKISAIWDKTPINVAYKIMKLSKMQALPIINSKLNLVGIISLSDILSNAEIKMREHTSTTKATTEGQDWDWDSTTILYISSKRLTLSNKPVNEIMVKKVITVVEQTSISDCAKRMSLHNIDQLPVLNAEGELVGMINDIALIKLLL